MVMRSTGRSVRSLIQPCLFVFAVLLATTATAQVKALRLYQNKLEGFSLQVPDKWDGIPPQPTETQTIAKFASDAGKRGTAEAFELEILRFTPKAGTTSRGESPAGRSGGEGEGDGGEEAPPENRSEAMRRYLEESRPETFQAWYKDRARGYGAGELPAAVPMKVGDLEIKTYLVETFISQGPWQQGLYIGVVKTPDAEWAISYQVPSKELVNPKDKKAATTTRDLLTKSFKSFRIIAKEAQKPETTDESPVIAEIRKRVKRGLPQGWSILPTPKQQYVVVHNIPQEKTRQIQFAKDIVKHLENIRTVYEKLFPPKKPITAVSVVRVCQDREEYHQYGGPGGSAGYWNSMDEELVIYDASKEGGKRDSFSTLFHEAFHQYIHYAVGEFSPHSWFNEGYGDYFAGANPERSYSIEPFSWRTGVVKDAVASNKNHPLAKLVKMTQAEYYSDPSTCYAQGWALVFFLKSKAVEKHPAWAGILQRYFDAMVATGNLDKALEAGFKDVDMEALNRAYVDFIKAGFK